MSGSRRVSKNRYASLLEEIFVSRYEKGKREIPFLRDDLVRASKKLRIKLPKNIGDVIYSGRYRSGLPEAIVRTQPEKMEWVIEGKGTSRYAFCLVSVGWIIPNPQLASIKIPDSTPEIVSAYALSDEQALLAKVRYNRLLDIFLGVSAYSLQNHLRTNVSNLGQVEIDEIYVAVDKRGRQFVLPVQAKGGSDKLATVQTKQDMECCAEKFPHLICRSISAQFVEDNLIALFELGRSGREIRIVDERHYRLVPADQITREDLAGYDR